MVGITAPAEILREHVALELARAVLDGEKGCQDASPDQLRLEL